MSSLNHENLKLSQPKKKSVLWQKIPRSNAKHCPRFTISLYPWKVQRIWCDLPEFSRNAGWSKAVHSSSKCRLLKKKNLKENWSTEKNWSRERRNNRKSKIILYSFYTSNKIQKPVVYKTSYIKLSNSKQNWIIPTNYIWSHP